ncbi:MAG: hypothetical protein K2X82_30015 [Gemmataceae bacterium]|nr:hypothetical protein [Gemmataceae bacterium]
MRVRWPAVGLVAVVGCQTLLAPYPPPVEPPEAPGFTPPLPAGEEDGGRGLASDDPLTLAADCLTRGDRPAAAAHLAAYVRGHPDQPMFRAQLAELLFTLDRRPDAKAEFERFVADAQAADGPLRGHLVHCHTRLMQIGQAADDRFAERFHRGVGLLLLAADGAPEEVLCQALAALNEAKEARPADPRVHLYLADAHDRAGNRRAAAVARKAARNLARPGDLSPAEATRLALGGEPGN